MGKQRAQAVRGSSWGKLVSVYDADAARALRLADEFGCRSAASLEQLLNEEVDAVVVAAPHFLSHEITAAALQAGKHVLCEKPVGMTAGQCRDLISRRRGGQVLAAGFNYRFYPGVRLAQQMIRNGDIGVLTHVRSVLGHGGRPGMENEWKTSKELCGGGALLDPGIHVLDVIRHITGEYEDVTGSLARTFWPIEVEDNAFIAARGVTGVHAQMHISITEWKSRFSLDFFGTDGCIRVRGRSGFYGPQSVSYNKRWEWLQPDFRETVTEFPPEDTSFAAEMTAFANTVAGVPSPDLGRAEDCLRLLEIIEHIYDTTPISGVEASMAAAR
jgi:predicted dehydrogenase